MVKIIKTTEKSVSTISMVHTHPEAGQNTQHPGHLMRVQVWE
jgi:hypothetical protein